MLGLDSRAPPLQSAASTWALISKLSSEVAKTISYLPPASTEAGLFVSVSETWPAPDAAGWIGSPTPVPKPFWIRKLDLARLRELEDALDVLRRKGHATPR
jgi:hypothetical protein